MNSASSNKENPLTVSCIVNLFSSCFSPCLPQSFLWASNSIRSSAHVSSALAVGFFTTSATWESVGDLLLNSRTWHSTFYTVCWYVLMYSDTCVTPCVAQLQYCKVRKSTTSYRGFVHVTMYTGHVT